MENTLENKVKFFAQYWGQDVFHSVHMNEIRDAVSVNSDVLYSFAQYGFLKLKPLSSITDEEAIYIAQLRYDASPHYHTIKDGKCMVSCYENQKELPLLISDFLRSKGYALPWMGLSVEKLQKYGWIKLKNNEHKIH